MAYELVDLNGCNLVGSYPSQDVALLVVLETIRQSGEEAASSLSLGTDDPTGRADGELIAQGEALIQLARGRYDDDGRAVANQSSSLDVTRLPQRA